MTKKTCTIFHKFPKKKILLNKYDDFVFISGRGFSLTLSE